MDFWSFIGAILWFMLLFAWFSLVIVILADLLSDPKLSGWAKGRVVPVRHPHALLGVLVYLIARGPTMGERVAEHAQRSDREFRQQVQDVAQPHHRGRRARQARRPARSRGDLIRRLRGCQDQASRQVINWPDEPGVAASSTSSCNARPPPCSPEAKVPPLPGLWTLA